MRQFENLKIGWRSKMDFEPTRKIIGLILTPTFFILNSFFE
jgi:hypothetical protein